ncbi:MAG: hypothetical protein E4G95_02550, partial [Bacteroidia bacterium]
MDLGDGIMIYVKTGGGSIIDSVGYIDESVTGSLISGRKIGEIAVAGRLYTEIHTLFMMARNENRRVLNWYNLGYSGGGRFNAVGGNFGNFGFDVPLDERNTRYPLFDTIAGLPSLCFDGNNFLKSGYAAETDITGGESLSIEMWVYDENPTAGEVIMGWQSEDGTSASAPLAWPAGIAGNDRWRHLVVSCGIVTETWYLDGEVVSSVPREMRIDPGHRIVLGGTSENTASFDGCLLTLRVHRDSITPAQVVHNYRGGGMLGTTLKFNYDPLMTPSDDKAYFTWSDADPGAAFMVVSEHFDQRVSLDWINTWLAADKDAFYARVPDMLELAEACYENYGSFHALRLPVVSIHPKYRGDGIKYRIKIGTTDGANFMGWHDQLGFGYGMQFPGYFNPHELVHGTQAQTGSGMQGNYWEAHANWPQTYMGMYQTVPSFLEMRDQNLFEASGRSYYHARLMFQHLAESPEYGPLFISKMWFDGANTAYPWITFKEIDPDPLTPLGYEFGRMVQKNVTWDYTIHRPLNPDDYYDPDLYRNNVRDNYEVAVVQGYVLLDSISGETGWLRPPKAKIPQQTGWNIVPLEPEGSEVSAELSGYRNEERGSSWYGGFVSVNNDGISRYSDIFRDGESLSFTLNSDEPDLYFIVAAIPGNIMAVDMTGDVKSDAQEPFPYKVRFTGVQQRDMFREYYAKKFENISGHIHANGGGFVDNRAIVSATAYVGPGAYVIGTSQVLDSARLEDFAVVENSTVEDHAIVSGHGNVTGNSSVSAYARVRDFARVSNSSGLTEYGKVAEHASLESGNGNTNSGYTTMKGIAIKYDGDASGTAMIDHHFAKGQDITRGKWFSWSWGSGRNPGEEDQDFNGLYMSMSFEEDHPFMAWDDHGINWGYLVNGASLVTDPAYGGVLS